MHRGARARGGARGGRARGGPRSRASPSRRWAPGRADRVEQRVERVHTLARGRRRGRRRRRCVRRRRRRGGVGVADLSAQPLAPRRQASHSRCIAASRSRGRGAHRREVALLLRPRRRARAPPGCARARPRGRRGARRGRQTAGRGGRRPRRRRRRRRGCGRGRIRWAAGAPSPWRATAIAAATSDCVDGRRRRRRRRRLGVDGGQRGDLRFDLGLARVVSCALALVFAAHCLLHPLLVRRARLRLALPPLPRPLQPLLTEAAELGLARRPPRRRGFVAFSTVVGGGVEGGVERVVGGEAARLPRRPLARVLDEPAAARAGIVHRDRLAAAELAVVRREVRARLGHHWAVRAAAALPRVRHEEAELLPLLQHLLHAARRRQQRLRLEVLGKHLGRRVRRDGLVVEGGRLAAVAEEGAVARARERRRLRRVAGTLRRVELRRQQVGLCERCCLLAHVRREAAVAGDVAAAAREAERRLLVADDAIHLGDSRPVRGPAADIVLRSRRIRGGASCAGRSRPFSSI